MADVPEELCTFCKKGEEYGSLRNTSDENILAHYSCLLFSPRVITEPQQDSQDNIVEFDIPSVILEIDRGKKLSCSHCQIKGATVGCNNRRCRKTYHYLCVTEAEGIHVREEDKELYIAYCYKHKAQAANNNQLDKDTETSGTLITSACSNESRKKKPLKIKVQRQHATVSKIGTHQDSQKKRKKKMECRTARKKLRFDRMDEPGTERNAEMRYDSAIHTNEKDKEVPGPSRTRPLHIDLIIRSDSEPDAESLESNGSHATQITAEQNAGMRAESEKKHTLSDHTYHEQMVALGTSTPLLQQSQVTIVIGSDTETEDELPTFNGSQLVCIKREGNTTKDDTSVTDTPSRVVQETPPSPASECTSSFSTDFSRTPEISRSVSLSGFPKRNRKRKRKRNNPQLETALSTMPPEERDAYSQLYDEVGGSLAMSEDFSTYDCDGEQMEDASSETEEDIPEGEQMEDAFSVTVEDIPENQHTGTYATSDENNPKIAALESSVSTHNPDLSASSSHVVKSSPSAQFINITNKTLVHSVSAHCSDVPVDQTAAVDRRKPQSVAHLSAIATGTNLSIVQPSCYPLVNNKCTEMAASSTRANEAFLVMESLVKEAPASREVLPTFPGVKTSKASEVQNATCHPSLLHIKTLSNLLRHSPAVTSAQSGQFINITNKVKSTNILQGTIFHPVNVAKSSERLASISGETLTPSDGENNARAEPKDIYNGNNKLVSMSAVSHNPTKPLDDQVWSSSSTNKASDKQQPMRSLNMNNVSNEQHNKDKDLLLANLGKTMKKHAAHNVSRHAPSKTFCFANTDILLDKEPLSSPSVSKTSGEQPKGTPVPTTVLVHAVNSHAMDVPVDQTATVPQRQIKSVGHVSAITTGTDLSIVQPSCSSRVDNKCTEMASSFPRAKETFHVKELLIKEALTSREEAPLTSPGVKGGTTSEVEKATCRPSLLHLKALSYQLKQGYFLQSFKKINVQLPSNGKSLSTLQSKVVDLVSEQSPEHSIISQQTQNYLGDVEENLENSGGATSEQTSEHHIISQQKYLSRVDGDLRKSGQTADEPATLDDLLDDGDMVVKEITHEDEDTVLCGQTEEEPASSGGLLEDGDMAVEEMTHAVEDTVLLYGQTADEPASPGNRPEDGPMLVKEITPANEDTVLLTGQTADEPASSRDLQEDEPMLVEEITHTDEDPSDTTNVAVLTAKSSQTAISSGFPANVDKSMYLSIDQKSKLMESYKEAEEQMSRTGDTTKAAQAFWDLCRENKCREFLLTLVTCYMKSIFHKIVHEQPKDRDFEQAFSFLQASECFAEFMNGTEDDQAKINSRTSSRETYSESDSESVGFSTEVKDQEEITRDKDPDGMKPESPEPSHTSNKVGQCTTDEDRNKVETECSKTFSLSVNRKVKESSEGKDHNGIQCESSLESNRTEKISGGEQHDDVQGESCESSSESSRKEQSTVGIDIDRMETELAAASRFSPSASSRSDLVLPENPSWRHRTSEEIQLKTMKTSLQVLNIQLQNLQCQLQQQTEDGDADFARNLLQFLRKVPQDKKVATQISILKVFLPDLDQ